MIPDDLNLDPQTVAQTGIPSGTQSQTLHLVTTLSLLRPDWAHALILSFGLTPAGAALALAANVAGATCLSVDSSPDLCHSALRSGAVDFSVNTLDEALRVLKNEIRQGRPLSVALSGNPEGTLSEILDRGLLPQLLTAFPAALKDSAAPGDRSAPGDPALSAYGRAALSLALLGTTLLAPDADLPSALPGRRMLDTYLAEHALTERTFDFASAAELRSFDTRLLHLLPTGDRRRRWALAASRYFSRNRQTGASSYRRTLFLTAKELVALSSSGPEVGAVKSSTP